MINEIIKVGNKALLNDDNCNVTYSVDNSDKINEICETENLISEINSQILELESYQDEDDFQASLVKALVITTSVTFLSAGILMPLIRTSSISITDILFSMPLPVIAFDAYRKFNKKYQDNSKKMKVRTEYLYNLKEEQIKKLEELKASKQIVTETSDYSKELISKENLIELKNKLNRIDELIDRVNKNGEYDDIYLSDTSLTEDEQRGLEIIKSVYKEDNKVKRIGSL